MKFGNPRYLYIIHEINCEATEFVMTDEINSHSTDISPTLAIAIIDFQDEYPKFAITATEVLKFLQNTPQNNLIGVDQDSYSFCHNEY